MGKVALDMVASLLAKKSKRVKKDRSRYIEDVATLSFE